MGENTQIETMKKIVASVGLIAVGASSVHTAAGAALSGEAPKPWSVSATLRGFYDDNVNTSPYGSPKQQVWGYQVSPGINLNWSGQQTTFTLGYLYTFLYYDTTPAGQTQKYDQNQQFNAVLNHAFSERYSISVADSFVLGQEPDLLRSGAALDSFQRVPGDNIRNDGQIKFDAQITPVFGAEIGYENAFFKYADDTVIIFPFQASSAGLLNRIENYIHLDGRWTIQPETIGVLGYKYARKDYTADQVIGFDTSNIYMSDSRNYYSHYGYIGADHIFRPDFSGSIRVGASYSDYYNEPGQPSQVNPYLQASLQYTYLPECSFSIGVSVDQNSTDMFSAENGSITTSAQSQTVYGTITHKLASKIYGSATAQFQNSRFIGGSLNDENEQYFLAGLNLEYRFNPHLSANIGYNFDSLNSEVPNRSFDRNRAYVGVTASY